MDLASRWLSAPARYSEARYLRRLGEALEGRRIVVTGASSGIGRAFALQVAAAGGEAVLVARRAEELERTAAECERRGGGASVHVADLSTAEAARALAREILRAGPVAVLVNNAGRSIRRRLLDCKAEDFDRLMAVNYSGPVALTMGLLPSMVERGDGHVIQISTIGVQTGAPNFGAYVAAKAGVDHFARTLRLECRRSGIDVTTMQVPLVRTPMMAPTRIYEVFPALGVERAARRIGWAVVKRPVRVAPRWATALEVVHAVAPGLLQRAFDLAHDPLHVFMERRLKKRDRVG